VAERALAITGADGIAIALAEGEAIVCRASAGSIAPDAGVRLDPNSGFSGACLRREEIVRCDDAETDARVNVQACRALGARSMVAVPLTGRHSVIGLLEAFSTECYGFNDSDVRSLNLLAELILSALKPEEEDRLAEISQQVVGRKEQPVETSPTARGIFIREQLLCQHVPNPPPGVNTQVPEPTPDRPLARRQRMQAHVENPTCASCHRLMDPIGFGLENYDASGRWRDKEVIEFESSDSKGRDPGKKVELPIDARGEIAGLANSAFSEPKQIGRVLADSRACQECVVKQLFRFAFGRMETSADREAVRSAVAAFRESRFRFKELLVALVRAPQFLDGLAQ